MAGSKFKYIINIVLILFVLVISSIIIIDLKNNNKENIVSVMKYDETLKKIYY